MTSGDVIVAEGNNDKVQVLKDLVKVKLNGYLLEKRYSKKMSDI